MRARPGIFHDAIFHALEIPERGQSRLAAGQPPEHRLANLRFRARDLPDADLIDCAFEVCRGVIRRHSLAKKESPAIFQSGETPRVIVSAGERAIQVESHPAFAGDGGDVAPLLRAQEIRDRDFVELPLRIADDEPQCLRIALRPYRKILPRVAVIEDALELAIEIIP